MPSIAGTGDLMGTCDLHGHRFEHKIEPVMGQWFLVGMFYVRGYGFGLIKPTGFVPVAISMHKEASDFATL